MFTSSASPGGHVLMPTMRSQETRLNIPFKRVARFRSAGRFFRAIRFTPISDRSNDWEVGLID